MTERDVSVTTRLATLDDAAALEDLDRQTWSPLVTPADRGHLAFFATTSPDDVLVACVDGAVVGYAQVARPTPVPANAHVLMLAGLAVSPTAQRRGVGQTLLQAVEALAVSRGAPRLTLRVLSVNTAARALYAGHGFGTEGVLPGEFLLPLGDGGNVIAVDDVLMGKSLPARLTPQLPDAQMVPPPDKASVPTLATGSVPTLATWTLGGQTLTLRRAVAGDVADIVTLLAHDQLGATREDVTDLSPYLSAFAAIDEQDSQLLLVVTGAAEAVVGTLQFTVLPGLARRGARRAQIEAVRVRHDLRGQGVGAALVTWAIEEGRRRGCAMVQLTTDKRRTDAHRFYERLGFVASHDGMKVQL